MIYYHLNPKTKGCPSVDESGFAPTTWMAREYAFVMAGLDHSVWDCVEYWLVGTLMVAQSTESDLVSWKLAGSDLQEALDDVAATRAELEGRDLDLQRLKESLRRELKRDRKARSSLDLREHCWNTAMERAAARRYAYVWVQDLLPALIESHVESIERAIQA